MSSFAGLFTTLTFGKNKSLLAIYQALKGYVYLWGESWKWEARRSSFQFLGPRSLCGVGTVIPFYLSHHPKTKLFKYLFLLSSEILFLFWTLLLPCWTPSFQWCVKCDGKLNCLSLWCYSWFPENGMDKFALFPLESCLLTTPVFCVVPRTNLVNDFFSTGTSILHSYCE